MSLASDRAARPTICALYCIAGQRETAKNGGPRKETAHGCQATKKFPTKLLPEAWIEFELVSHRGGNMERCLSFQRLHLTIAVLLRRKCLESLLCALGEQYTRASNRSKSKHQQ